MRLILEDGKIKRRLGIISVVLALTMILFCCRISADGTERSGEDVREVIRMSFYGFCESIDVSKFGVLPSELSQIFSSVIKDDPYLIFVNTSMSYSFESGGCVRMLYPTYTLSGIEAFEAWDICREWIRDLAREALAFADDERRALYLHDRICLFTEYDHSLSSDSIFSLVKSGKGTCQAYAMAYIAALREVGISAHFVASDTIEHIWCCLMLDGEWYHADPTWDDSASVEAGRVSRRHFLMSDRLAEERGHRDWYSYNELKCISDRYDGFDFDACLRNNGDKGDVDHNGKVELRDIILLKRKLIYGDACFSCADINTDGVLDSADVKALRKKLLRSH